MKRKLGVSLGVVKTQRNEAHPIEVYQSCLLAVLATYLTKGYGLQFSETTATTGFDFTNALLRELLVGQDIAITTLYGTVFAENVVVDT